MGLKSFNKKVLFAILESLLGYIIVIYLNIMYLVLSDCNCLDQIKMPNL